MSDWKVTYTKRRRSVRERLARWYMSRVAGRYCPCEWPIKSKALIRLCGRVDDSVCNADFRDFVHFHLHVHQNQTTSSGGATEGDA